MPKLCLNMIVKNEEHIIKETLESVSKYIDYYVISDTGSTDDTINVIKGFFDEKGISGEIYHDEWVNFGHNRSLAFKHAQGKSDYMWVIDADDVIIGYMDLSSLTKDYYALRIGKKLRYYRKNIFKNFKDFQWKYVGVIHEYAHCDKPGMVGGTIPGNYYVESRRLGDRNKDPDKYLKDALILEEEIKKDPTNTRNVFYCAKSYFDSGRYEKAIELYERRIKMDGYQDEIFYSLYQMGLAKLKLGYNWPDVERSFLRAHRHSKYRLEPIYEITRHYRLENDYDNAFIYASYGIKIPFPTKPHLFLSIEIYKWRIVEEYALAAYYTDRFRESYMAYKKLITLGDISREDIDRLKNGYNYALHKFNTTKCDSHHST